MIRVIKTETPGVAVVCYCDQCGKQILDAGLALYTWREYWAVRTEEEGHDARPVLPPGHPSRLVDEGQFYTLHKKCIDAFEAQHGGSAYNWPWVELIDLPIFLTYNSGLTLEDLQRRLEERKKLRL